MGLRGAADSRATGGAFNSGGGRGFDTAPGQTPPKKGSIDTPPQNLTETDSWAPEVIRTHKSAKNENGVFGISASRGFRKVIMCHGFGGGGEVDHFQR